MRVVIPSRAALIVFSLTPPIGKTLPVREISPVIPMFCLIGLFNASESKAVVIVIPALGPSLGVAPSGTWKWI